MDGVQDETKFEKRGTTQETQNASKQVSGNDSAAKARADYEAALAERDARIAKLEDEIAESAKTAEDAEKLRAEMNELRRTVLRGNPRLRAPHVDPTHLQ